MYKKFTKGATRTWKTALTWETYDPRIEILYAYSVTLVTTQA